MDSVLMDTINGSWRRLVPTTQDSRRSQTRTVRDWQADDLLSSSRPLLQNIGCPAVTSDLNGKSDSDAIGFAAWNTLGRFGTTGKQTVSPLPWGNRREKVMVWATQKMPVQKCLHKIILSKVCQCTYIVSYFATALSIFRVSEVVNTISFIAMTATPS